MDIHIEKGVPIPEKQFPRKGAGPWQKFLRALEVGDSFLIPASEKGTARNLPYAAKSIGFKLTRRTLEDGSIRFWRIA